MILVTFRLAHRLGVRCMISLLPPNPDCRGLPPRHGEQPSVVPERRPPHLACWRGGRGRCPLRMFLVTTNLKFIAHAILKQFIVLIESLGFFSWLSLLVQRGGVASPSAAPSRLLVPPPPTSQAALSVACVAPATRLTLLRFGAETVASTFR